MRAYMMQIRQGKPGGGKGPLVKYEHAPCLGTTPVETLFTIENEMETETFTKGAHPMNAQQPQGYEPTDTAKTLNCFNNSEARAEELIASKTQYRYAVRRITPTEGERLQGFQDNWTRPCFTPDQITDELVDRFIGIHQNWSAINGKPNAKPKSRKWVRNWLTKISSAECPDGPRYKAIGNSMSVNVMSWIGQRIQMEEN